jgi:hypothetical protein
MPTATYDLIASTTLAASTSSVVFGSLPQTYRDLILVCVTRHNVTTDQQAALRPNGDTGNASLVYMDGSGTSPNSGTDTKLSLYYVGSTTTANSPVTSITQIMDYSATDKHKILLTRAGSSFNPVSTYASRWASNTAITSLVMVATTGGDFTAGTTFNLYGVIS